MIRSLVDEVRVLVDAWRRGPLSQTDPEHLLAFRVVQAYLASLSANERARAVEGKTQ